MGSPKIPSITLILVLCVMISTQPAWAQWANQPAQSSPAPSSPKQGQDAVVLAKVGERELTIGHFRQFAMASGLGDLARTPVGQIQLLRLLIEDALIDKALELEGLVKADATYEARVNAVAQLQEKHFPLPPMPEPAAIKAYYEANREQFGIPELVRIVQIQFRTDQDQSAGSTAKERSEQALKRLEKGEDFRKLATELTESPRGREIGPDRGFLPRNAEPWLRDALKGLNPAQRTGIVQSPVGYEILLMTDWRAPLIAEFDTVQANAAELMRRSAQKQAREAYIKTIASKVGVTIIRQGMENANPMAQ